MTTNAEQPKTHQCHANATKYILLLRLLHCGTAITGRYIYFHIKQKIFWMDTQLSVTQKQPSQLEAPMPITMKQILSDQVFNEQFSESTNCSIIGSNTRQHLTFKQRSVFPGEFLVSGKTLHARIISTCRVFHPAPELRSRTLQQTHRPS